MNRLLFLWTGVSGFALSMTLWANSVSEQPHLVSFEAGCQAFAAGDYTAACRAFSKQLESENRPNVRYNLARSYIEAGQAGKALWQYQQLKLQTPRDAQVRLHVQQLREKLKLAIPDEPWGYAYWGKLNLNEWILVALGCMGLGLGGWGLRRFWGWQGWKGSFLSYLGFLGGLAASSGIIGWASLRGGAIVVEEQGAKITVSPAPYSEELMSLGTGQWVWVQRVQGDDVFVTVPTASGQVQGWLSKDKIGFIWREDC